MRLCTGPGTETVPGSQTHSHFLPCDMGEKEARRTLHCGWPLLVMTEGYVRKRRTFYSVARRERSQVTRRWHGSRSSQEKAPHLAVAAPLPRGF